MKPPFSQELLVIILSHNHLSHCSFRNGMTGILKHSSMNYCTEVLIVNTLVSMSTHNVISRMKFQSSVWICWSYESFL